MTFHRRFPFCPGRSLPSVRQLASRKFVLICIIGNRSIVRDARRQSRLRFARIAVSLILIVNVNPLASLATYGCLMHLSLPFPLQFIILLIDGPPFCPTHAFCFFSSTRSQCRWIPCFCCSFLWRYLTFVLCQQATSSSFKKSTFSACVCQNVTKLLFMARLSPVYNFSLSARHFPCTYQLILYQGQWPLYESFLFVYLFRIYILLTFSFRVSLLCLLNANCPSTLVSKFLALANGKCYPFWDASH